MSNNKNSNVSAETPKFSQSAEKAKEIQTQIEAESQIQVSNFNEINQEEHKQSQIVVDEPVIAEEICEDKAENGSKQPETA